MIKLGIVCLFSSMFLVACVKKEEPKKTEDSTQLDVNEQPLIEQDSTPTESSGEYTRLEEQVEPEQDTASLTPNEPEEAEHSSNPQADSADFSAHPYQSELPSASSSSTQDSMATSVTETPHHTSPAHTATESASEEDAVAAAIQAAKPALN